MLPSSSSSTSGATASSASPMRSCSDRQYAASYGITSPQMASAAAALIPSKTPQRAASAEHATTSGRSVRDERDGAPPQGRVASSMGDDRKIRDVNGQDSHGVLTCRSRPEPHEGRRLARKSRPRDRDDRVDRAVAQVPPHGGRAESQCRRGPEHALDARGRLGDRHDRRLSVARRAREPRERGAHGGVDAVESREVDDDEAHPSAREQLRRADPVERRGDAADEQSREGAHERGRRRIEVVRGVDERGAIAGVERRDERAYGDAELSARRRSGELGDVAAGKASAGENGVERRDARWDDAIGTRGDAGRPSADRSVARHLLELSEVTRCQSFRWERKYHTKHEHPCENF